MPKAKQWDLSSGRSLDAAAEWIRARAGAVLVLVVRGEDVACALDAAVAPKDALTMVEVAMPEVAAKIEAQRTEARCKANMAASGTGRGSRQPAQNQNGGQ